jgi:hypothetical protein
MTKKRSTQNLDRYMTKAGPVTIRRADGTAEIRPPHAVDDGMRFTRHTIPRQIAQRVWKRDGYQCRYCGIHGGKAEQLQLDFKNPGAGATLKNLVVACLPCIAKKGAAIWHPRVRSQYGRRKGR